MRKSELSVEQLAYRSAFVERLAGANWSGQLLNDAFEEGWWVDYEATMDYTNAQARLSLLYDAEGKSLELLVDEARRFVFVIEFGERFEQVLELLIAAQDRLAFRTLDEMLRALLELCPSGLYVYSNDVGRVPVDEEVLTELRAEIEDLVAGDS